MIDNEKLLVWKKPKRSKDKKPQTPSIAGATSLDIDTKIPRHDNQMYPDTYLGNQKTNLQNLREESQELVDDQIIYP